MRFAHGAACASGLYFAELEPIDYQLHFSRRRRALRAAAYIRKQKKGDEPASRAFII